MQHLMKLMIDWHEVYHDIPSVSWRTVLLFFVVLAVMRWSGKRTVTAMAPFDLALVIMISEVASIPVSDPKLDVFNGLVPVVILGTLHVILTTLNLHAPKLEEVTEGRPRLLVKGGRAIAKNLRRERVSMGDLNAALRMQQVSNLAQVDEAWLEPTGGVSVLLRKPEQPLTEATFSSEGLTQMEQIVAQHMDRLRAELREWLGQRTALQEVGAELWPPAPPPAQSGSSQGSAGQPTSPLQLPKQLGGLTAQEAGLPPDPGKDYGAAHGQGKAGGGGA